MRDYLTLKRTVRLLLFYIFHPNGLFTAKANIPFLWLN